MSRPVRQYPFNGTLIYNLGPEGCAGVAYFVRQNEINRLLGAHLYAAITVPAIRLGTEHGLFKVEILVNKITRADFHAGWLLAQPASVTLFFVYSDGHGNASSESSMFATDFVRADQDYNPG